MNGRHFIAGMAVLGLFLLAAVAIYIYFSPYQSCLRAEAGGRFVGGSPALICAQATTGR